MKQIYLFAFVVIISLSSCNGPKNNQQEIILGDTIKTASGLRYFYEKIGKGRRVEPGCEMATYLSLKVGGKVVWTSADQKDSLFTYIAGYTRLIKGFSEMSLLLREGDEVVAILPNSLAYGEKGAGDIIPPHSILIYDKFKVLRVNAPKGIMADTLFKAIEQGGEKAVMAKYKQIMTTADSVKYHRGSDHFHHIWRKLTDDNQHKKAAEVAACFADLTKDNKLWYKMVLSLENLGEIQEAKENLEILLDKEPNDKQMSEKMIELNEKLSNK